MNPEVLLQEGAAALDVPLSPQQLGRLLCYLAELQKWMRRINLVARDTSTAQLVELHFLDSLSMAPMLAGHPAPHLLDIGSGAGFPGLVLASIFPDSSFTLLEPRQKRAAFLRHVVRLLELPQVEVVEKRLEEFDATDKQYSQITGRAVAEPAAFLPMVAPFARTGAEVVLFLARGESLANLPENLQAVWQIHASRTLMLPFSRAPRFLASMRRVG